MSQLVVPLREQKTDLFRVLGEKRGRERGKKKGKEKIKEKGERWRKNWIKEEYRGGTFLFWRLSGSWELSHLRL